ncbi:hypothetical protein MPSEU_000734100 [Mayamaea pseudoterrestris]|nr:hypothetical protein MPSEU_000734100 [Mayamaea pseudoterrestris]
MCNSTIAAAAARPIDESVLMTSASYTDTVIRASLCLNNRGVQLLALGCFKEANEVLEDAIHILKSSRRVVPDEALHRILKRKLGRAQTYLLQAPKLKANEPPSHWIHIISSEDCLTRLGRLDIFCQISLLAFRLECHEDMSYTSAVFVHNLALARIGLGEIQAAVRLLTMANTLLSRTVNITSGTVSTAMVVLGALQFCYGEGGFGEGLKECHEKMQMLRMALKESGGICPSPSPYTLAAAA